MAMVLTVCQDTASSAAIAEMVVRSIINQRTDTHRIAALATDLSRLGLSPRYRRNTFRAQQRVVEERGAASFPRSWLNTVRPHAAVAQR